MCVALKRPPVNSLFDRMISSFIVAMWDNFSWIAKWSPLFLLFVPLLLVIWFYLMAIAAYVYKWRKKELYEAFNDSFWDGFRISLAAITEAQGKIWHNIEYVGLENLPKKRGALLIGYHGAIPLDAYYFVARCALEKRKVKVVVDKFLFKAPGLGLLLKVLNLIPGTVSDCVSALEKGEILLIYPGGLRESLLSDENYNLIWNSRLGFSRVALEADVPIIPFFTQNIREAARSVKVSARFASWLYEKTRLPLIPIIGIFPVELKMIFGRPISFDDEESPLVVADVTTKKVQDLIKTHQNLPGSIFRELYSRFITKQLGRWSRQTVRKDD